MSPIERIVSGGQTGVDRAALDEALERGLNCGGWCPQGRLAEDGAIPDRYPLGETPSSDYAERTRWNVRDSDGTLILTAGLPRVGTALTQTIAEELGRPCLVVDLCGIKQIADVVEWTKRHRIATLNVAGPRASQQPEIYEQARAFLGELLNAL